jgi:hypothetical protein
VGVDFGLIGRDDQLLGNLVHYRDARTKGMIEAACQRVPRETIFERTGIQFQPFNTLCWLPLSSARFFRLKLAYVDIKLSSLRACVFVIGRRSIGQE